MHGLVIRTGTGMFTQNWPTYVFVREMASDGRHLQEFLATNASLSYAQADSPILPYPIISSTSRNLTPAREWISKVSIDRRFAYITPGVEYTWTVSTHLLGSQRQSAPVGWTDILESNRASRKQQIHLRTGFAVKGQTFTGHYEWIRARDNTDGPFSYPGRQNDLSGEWAPASNVAPHNVTLVAHFKIKSISLTLLEAAHTAVPLNVTSGLDPERNGLYTDRAGRLRNSGTGPAYSALSVYVHRRFALPSLSSRSNRKLYLDAGLQGENVLDHKNYVTLNGITSSPLFGQPLAALAGRSLRISVGIVPH
jgi:hypothetical protein